MKKVLWITLLVALLLPFSMRLHGQSITAKPYGHGGLAIPTTSGAAYKLHWARLGVEYGVDSISGKFELDIQSSALKYAYTQRNLGHGITVGVGKALSPIAFLYPGPRTQQLSQAPHMFDGSAIYAIGAFAKWTWQGVSVRAMQYADQRISGTIGYRGLSAFYAEDELAGALFESPWITPVFHPSIGFGSRPDGLTTVTFQNFWQVTKKTRFYTQADICDGQNSGLVGISYEQAPLCFVRVFREFSENQHSSWAAELTFAF